MLKGIRPKRLEVVFDVVLYINLRFSYLLTY